MARRLLAALALAASCSKPVAPSHQPSGTVLVGAFRGPYTVLGTCGNCETQDRFFVEATRSEANVLIPPGVPGVELVQSQARCRAIGRWVDHEGSCGQGRCRSFTVEAVEPPPPP